MTIKYLSGDRVSGLSTDSKPTMADGSIFIETDTGKRFVKKVGVSDWEEVSGGNTVVPTAVTGLSTTSNSISQITVSYTGYGNDGITGYKVESKPSGGSWSTFSASTTDTTHAVIGLSTYTDYDFRVSAINSVGTSSSVATSSVTKTQGITPSDPTNFTTSVISTTQINLSWTASATGNPTPTYKIEYKLSSAGSWTELVASQSGTTYNKTGLSGYTEYDFRVSALNAQGTSNTVAVTATRTNGVAPAQVTGLTLTDSDPNVGISWSADTTGIPSVTYTLEHSLSSTFASGITVKASGGTSTTYTDSSVTKDVAHYYRVKSVNAVSDGTYSAISNITIFDIGVFTTGNPTFSQTGGYDYYEYNSSGTVRVVGHQINVLVVAGGGRGGINPAGGGGGGEVMISDTFTMTTNTQDVTVGAGGGATAGDSSITASTGTSANIIAKGGGSGGNWSGGNGYQGGSGGGGGGSVAGRVTGTGATSNKNGFPSGISGSSYGNAGHSGYSQTNSSGGGGGGGAGANAVAKDGGAGKYISQFSQFGASGYFGGGGNGSAGGGSGSGGGGNGAGTANTGGGGKGGGYTSGGSGVVIIRHTT
jgi:hypothetical protein